MYRFKVWTGPVQVKVIADALRAKPDLFYEVWEGTEHVYFKSTMSQPELLTTVRALCASGEANAVIWTYFKPGLPPGTPGLQYR